jgi:hypothetical protein
MSSALVISPEESGKQIAKAFSQFATQKETAPGRFEHLYDLTVGKVITDSNTMQSAVLRNLTEMKNLPAVVAEIMKRNAAPVTDKTAQVADAMNEQRLTQIRGDEVTSKSITDLALLTKQLYGINEKILKEFTPKFATLVTMFSTTLTKLNNLAVGKPIGAPSSEVVAAEATVEQSKWAKKESEMRVAMVIAQEKYDSAIVAANKKNPVARGIDTAKAAYDLNTADINLKRATLEKETAEKKLNKANEELKVAGVPPVAPATPTAPAAPGTIGGMQVKEGAMLPGTALDAKIVAALSAVSAEFAGSVLTAGIDQFHKDKRAAGSGTSHPEGIAADVRLPGGVDKDKLAMIQKLVGPGIKAEMHANEGPGASGYHLHLQKITEEKQALQNQLDKVESGQQKLELAGLAEIMRDVLTETRESNYTLGRIYSVTA